jgi:uncharacterized protein YndB with AHSA1/START domain
MTTNAPESACLLIADISGYTSYLAGVELDHAQDILADLLDTVVSTLRPTFRLAKLEGDAAFVYSLAPSLEASLLQDAVERTYFAFRRRLRDIAQASMCECDACMRMPTLDLKIVVHSGDVARQRIAGREELAGRAVIEVHRLLKNDVENTLGTAAYALYSEACLRATGLDDPKGAGLVGHRETYEFLGELTVWVRDLRAAWDEERARTRVFVEPDVALATYEYVLPGPPALVWEYETSPARRPQWQSGVTSVDEEVRGGRRGVGTTNHCVHGKDAVVEEILDWRPFEYWTMRVQFPGPGVPRFVMTDVLTPDAEGTRLTIRVQRPRSVKDRTVLEMMEPMFRGALDSGAAALRPVIAEEVARRAAAVGGASEPDTPASAGRFLTAPVAVGAGVDSTVGDSS